MKTRQVFILAYTSDEDGDEEARRDESNEEETQEMTSEEDEADLSLNDMSKARKPSTM